MITFDELRQLMAFDTKGRCCVEIAFSVSGSNIFTWCWMGKLPDQKTGKDIYWYGLTSDGKNAFDYATFEEFASARVFDGKSLFEVWEDVKVLEINGCNPMEMLEMYLSGEGGFLGAPQ